MKSCRALVLIGDHKQLPPTLLSDTAMRLGLGDSLFGRLVSQVPSSAYCLKDDYFLSP